MDAGRNTAVASSSREKEEGSIGSSERALRGINAKKIPRTGRPDPGEKLPEILRNDTA
jgi:hypothetical protein